jgi:CTP:molybdopterin cytidylyltransferase MocA
MTINTVTQKKVGLVLLAAGEASRMGMPKQLLVDQKQPLIRHMAQLLLQLNQSLVVVLGARAKLIQPVIADLPLKVVVNKDWQLGMGTSVLAGLNALRDMDGILFCVVDQPYLNEKLLRTFLEAFDQLSENDLGIIAARYKNGRLGVPALFSKVWFEALEKVTPKEGARNIIRREQDKLLAIDFPEGLFDLDSPEDWDEFRKK